MVFIYFRLEFLFVLKNRVLKNVWFWVRIKRFEGLIEGFVIFLFYNFVKSKSFGRKNGIVCLGMICVCKCFLDIVLR